MIGMKELQRISPFRGLDKIFQNAGRTLLSAILGAKANGWATRPSMKEIAVHREKRVSTQRERATLQGRAIISTAA